MLPTARTVTAALMCLLLVVSCPLVRAFDEPQGPVTQATLDEALAKKLNDEDAARDTIRRLLERQDVQTLARGYGLDARRAAAAVGTLRGEELERVASQAAAVESQLAGGDVVVIRISLVVLLLLIIIAILVFQ
jgi:hypothetical protein